MGNELIGKFETGERFEVCLCVTHGGFETAGEAREQGCAKFNVSRRPAPNAKAGPSIEAKQQ
jgi:hypothetical protein